MYSLPIRPDEVTNKTTKLTDEVTNTGTGGSLVRTGKFKRVYERSGHFVESVTMENNSSQDIEFAFMEDPTPSDIDILSPYSAKALPCDPKAIWCRRTENPVAGGKLPEVCVREYWWTTARVKLAEDLEASLISRSFGSILPMQQVPPVPLPGQSEVKRRSISFQDLAEDLVDNIVENGPFPMPIRNETPGYFQGDKRIQKDDQGGGGG